MTLDKIKEWRDSIFEVEPNLENVSECAFRVREKELREGREFTADEVELIVSRYDKFSDTSSTSDLSFRLIQLEKASKEYLF